MAAAAAADAARAAEADGGGEGTLTSAAETPIAPLEAPAAAAGCRRRLLFKMTALTESTDGLYVYTNVVVFGVEEKRLGSWLVRDGTALEAALRLSTAATTVLGTCFPPPSPTPSASAVRYSGRWRTHLHSRRSVRLQQCAGVHTAVYSLQSVVLNNGASVCGQTHKTEDSTQSPAADSSAGGRTGTDFPLTQIIETV